MNILNVNGKDVQVNLDSSAPILWVLRDELKMTGTKYGCGAGLCGACTIHINDIAVRSCLMPIAAGVGQKITTIEHMAEDKIGQVVQAAWVKQDVVQCGYCQSGQIMTAVSLLRSNKNPTDADIDNAMSGNICRCGTYQRIRQAIKDAAAKIS